MEFSLRKLFLISFAFYHFGLAVSVTAIPQHETIRKLCMIASALGMMLIIGKDIISEKRMSRKQLIRGGIIVLLLTMSIISHDYFLLMLGLFTLTSTHLRDSDFETLFWISMYSTLIIALFSFVGCVTGFVPNINTPRGWGTEPRMAWGFNHSQVPTLFFFYIVLYYYMIKNKVKRYEPIVVIIITLVLAKIFDARNAMFSMFIFWLLILVYSTFKMLKINKTNNCFFSIGKIIPLMMVAFTFLTAYLYGKGNGLIVALDKLLSSRIRVSALNLQRVPVKLVNFISYEDYEKLLADTVDNGYLYISLRYGVVFILLTIVLFVAIARYLKYQNKPIACIALIAAGISVFVSNAFTGCYFLPFWVIALRSLYTRRRKLPLRGRR